MVRDTVQAAGQIMDQQLAQERQAWQSFITNNAQPEYQYELSGLVLVK